MAPSDASPKESIAPAKPALEQRQTGPQAALAGHPRPGRGVVTVIGETNVSASDAGYRRSS
jgi:hypothetical protein